MSIAVTNTKNALADKYGTLGTFISVHTASPGSTGASEATGGTPAYVRKATTWGAASGGTITGSEVTIDVPAGTYAYAGLWSAATGGTFIDTVAVVSTTLGAQGQLKITPTYTQS